jgi:hypothetical protein
VEELGGSKNMRNMREVVQKTSEIKRHASLEGPASSITLSDSLLHLLDENDWTESFSLLRIEDQ